MPDAATAESGRTEQVAVLQAVAAVRLAADSRGSALASYAALESALATAPDTPGLTLALMRQSVIIGDRRRAEQLASRLWAAGDRDPVTIAVMLSVTLGRRDWQGARALFADPLGSPAMDRAVRAPVLAWTAQALRQRAPALALMDGEGTGRRPGGAAQAAAALVLLADGEPAAAAELGLSLPVDETATLVLLDRLARQLTAGGNSEGATMAQRLTTSSLGGLGVVHADLHRAAPAVDRPATGVALWLGVTAEAMGQRTDPVVRVALARAATWLSPRDPFLTLVLADALDDAGEGRVAATLIDGVAVNDRLPTLLIRRGELALAAGERDDAADRARRALAGPAVPLDARLSAIELLRDAGDTARALSAVETLLAEPATSAFDRPLRSALAITRADLRLREGQWQAAAAGLDQALGVDPGNAVLLNFAGYSALERRVDGDRAMARIAAAARVAPDNAAIADSLGWAHVVNGNVADGLPLIEQAARSLAGNAVVGEHLGDARWLAGQRIGAMHAWRAALVAASDDGMRARISAKLAIGLMPGTMAP